MSAREPGIERHLACHSGRIEEPLNKRLEHTNNDTCCVTVLATVSETSIPKLDCGLPRRLRDSGDGLQRATKVLEAVQSLFDYVDAGGVTEPDVSIITESSTWNDCYIGFAQQAIRKILRGQIELADIYQHV